MNNNRVCFNCGTKITQVLSCDVIFSRSSVAERTPDKLEEEGKR